MELLPPLAHRWDLEADAYGLARTGACQSRAPADPECSDHREAIGEDHAKRGARGYDGGKKIKGRKRHLLVDTMGLILHLLVHEANIQD